MAYLTINGTDYSSYVNKLKVGTQHNFKSRVNASGNMMVKYINSKYVIEVGIIPLDADAMATLMAAVNGFQATLSFLDPESKELKEASCIVTQHSVEYYTIQESNVKFRAFSLVFTEL